ncbi:hypothetical protein H9L39_00469 [Fusarium oxysporum f. sp. albedinis]|nr:hypothetical protein H9L39_00469 [Fusarium oxysporum f. sp. albedinis]
MVKNSYSKISHGDSIGGGSSCSSTVNPVDNTHKGRVIVRENDINTEGRQNEKYTEPDVCGFKSILEAKAAIQREPRNP